MTSKKPNYMIRVLDLIKIHKNHCSKLDVEEHLKRTKYSRPFIVLGWNEEYLYCAALVGKLKTTDENGVTVNHSHAAKECLKNNLPLFSFFSHFYGLEKNSDINLVEIYKIPKLIAERRFSIQQKGLLKNNEIYSFKKGLFSKEIFDTLKTLSWDEEISNMLETSWNKIGNNGKEKLENNKNISETPLYFGNDHWTYIHNPCLELTEEQITELKIDEFHLINKNNDDHQ